MTCSSTGNNCIPEAPAITVNEYAVSLGAAGANYHHESLVRGNSAAGAGLVFTLAYVPVQSAEVKVFVNGSRQRPTTDYTLVDQTLTLVSALPTGESLDLDYLGTT